MEKPGHALSLQRHRRRAEHWVVVQGTARVTRGGRTLNLRENQSTYIPVGMKLRLGVPGGGPVGRLPGRGRHRALREPLQQSVT